MEQQTAAMHVVCPGLHVHTCKVVHPPGHLHGTVAGGIVGQLARPLPWTGVLGAEQESLSAEQSGKLGRQEKQWPYR
jgi:hypothetical protein